MLFRVAGLHYQLNGYNQNYLDIVPTDAAPQFLYTLTPVIDFKQITRFGNYCYPYQNDLSTNCACFHCKVLLTSVKTWNSLL